MYVARGSLRSEGRRGSGKALFAFVYHRNARMARRKCRHLAVAMIQSLFVGGKGQSESATVELLGRCMVSIGR